MGYNIELLDLDIEFNSNDNAEAFMKQMKKEIIDKQLNLSWVSTSTLLELNNFEDFMYELRYEIEKVDYDKYEVIDFTGCKLGDDDVIFKIMAPYINEGSYIKFIGEENEIFGYEVKNKEMHEILPDEKIKEQLYGNTYECKCINGCYSIINDGGTETTPIYCPYCKEKLTTTIKVNIK